MNNILMLTGAMLMLYDRVMPSRSVPSLVALLILAAGLYDVQGIIDAIRSRILVRIGRSLDEAMSPRVYDAIVRPRLKLGAKSEGVQPIRDLDTVRGFLSGAEPVALFDLPWMPVYLAVCFLFHTYIGLTALAGAIVLVTLTVVTEVRTRRPTRSATQFAVAHNALMEASRRNAEAITAMGMGGRIAPVDLAIVNSRGFVGARQSWQRLSRLLAHLPMLAAPIALQAPLKLLAVQMSR
jgi:ATP-binding cassette, subfamily C, type I secretion system permease/ATPase